MAITPVRRTVLRGAGQVLVAADEAGPADLLVMDVESGAAGVLSLGDLHHSQPAATVGILVPEGTRVDHELQRRGIVLPNLTLEVLAQLGVARDAVVRIPAGEGGTTETTSRARRMGAEESWKASAGRGGAVARPAVPPRAAARVARRRAAGAASGDDAVRDVPA